MSSAEGARKFDTGIYSTGAEGARHVKPRRRDNAAASGVAVGEEDSLESLAANAVKSGGIKRDRSHLRVVRDDEGISLVDKSNSDELADLAANYGVRPGPRLVRDDMPEPRGSFVNADKLSSRKDVVVEPLTFEESRSVKKPFELKPASKARMQDKELKARATAAVMAERERARSKPVARDQNGLVAPYLDKKDRILAPIFLQSQEEQEAARLAAEANNGRKTDLSELRMKLAKIDVTKKIEEEERQENRLLATARLKENLTSLTEENQSLKQDMPSSVQKVYGFLKFKQGQDGLPTADIFLTWYKEYKKATLQLSDLTKQIGTELGALGRVFGGLSFNKQKRENRQKLLAQEKVLVAQVKQARAHVESAIQYVNSKMPKAPQKSSGFTKAVAAASLVGVLGGAAVAHREQSTADQRDFPVLSDSDEDNSQLSMRVATNRAGQFDIEEDDGDPSYLKRDSSLPTRPGLPAERGGRGTSRRVERRGPPLSAADRELARSMGRQKADEVYGPGRTVLGKAGLDETGRNVSWNPADLAPSISLERQAKLAHYFKDGKTDGIAGMLDSMDTLKNKETARKVYDLLDVISNWQRGDASKDQALDALTELDTLAGGKLGDIFDLDQFKR